MAKKARRGFRYAIKVNRFITHLKKLGAARSRLRNYRLARRLGDTVSAPCSTSCRPASSSTWPGWKRFFRRLPTDLANVFEFRNSDWYVPETYALLERLWRILLRP